MNIKDLQDMPDKDLLSTDRQIRNELDLRRKRKIADKKAHMMPLLKAAIELVELERFNLETVASRLDNAIKAKRDLANTIDNLEWTERQDFE